MLNLKYLQWVWLLTIVQIIYSQGLNDHGMWGGIVAPTAEIHAEGAWVLEAKRSLPLYSVYSHKRVDTYGIAWNYTPISNLEVGGSYHQEQSYQTDAPRGDQGSISFKYQVPRVNEWLPQLAIGLQGLSNVPHPWKNVFFTSGYYIGYRELGLQIEFAGQYLPVSIQHNSTPNLVDNQYQSLSSFKLLFLLSEYRLMGEFVHNGDSFIENYGFWFSPFHEPESFYETPFFSVGGGVRNYFDRSSPEWWGTVQFSSSSWTAAQKAFISESKDPFFYLWLSPYFEFEKGVGHSEGMRTDWWVPLYEKSLGWRSSWLHRVAQSPRSERKYFDLNSAYFAGQFGTQTTTENLLLASTEYAVGYLGVELRGSVLRQPIKLAGWKSSFVDLGFYERQSKGIRGYGILTQPLHPLWLDGMWQNYVEGGFYANEKLGGRLISKVNLDYDIQTQVELGYQSELLFGILLSWTPNISKDFGPLAFGFLPTQRQAWTSNDRLEFNNLERDRLHDVFLSSEYYVGKKYSNDKSFHQVSDEEWCVKFPKNEFCLKQIDHDLDGVSDELDLCLDLAEDRDGYMDGDGCPDEDNDMDKIPDAIDQCPDVPEDRDGYMDGDGCPEDDNDQDGFTDLEDQCVNSPEDKDHFQDDDGCPDEDNDQDGIPDITDVCPNHPEDFDGVLDNDGCPDYSDDDEIPVDVDICPDEDEDFDGFQDDDGCPDLDNDHDEILDYADKCPNEREVFNSILDEDGCPD